MIILLGEAEAGESSDWPLDWTGCAGSGLCLRSAAGRGLGCTEVYYWVLECTEVYCSETARPLQPGPDCTEDSTEELEELDDTGQEEVW